MTVLTVLCQITPPRRYSPIRLASPAVLVSVFAWFSFSWSCLCCISP